MDVDDLSLFEDVEISVPDNDPAWRTFEKQFLKKPGEHLFGIGRTGSGKTQKAYYIAGKLAKYETVCWWDTGKSMQFGTASELSPLFSLGYPIHIIHPLEGTVIVRGSPVPCSTKGVATPAGIWHELKPNHINIVTANPFFLDPDLYAKWTSNAFRELILFSRRSPETIRHVLPLSIFHDEFQDVAPGRDMALSSRHRYAAILMAHNVNKLRAPGIRICAFTQRDTMIMPNVRNAFSWILCCRGTKFSRDDPELAQYNNLYSRLEVYQAILWYPNRRFDGRWRFPLIAGPEGLIIEHDGIIEDVPEAPRGRGIKTQGNTKTSALGNP
jgi:hypothetical protein